MNNDLAALFGDRDPASYEPATDFDVLSPGKYPCLIESAEVKQTKAGTGYYLGLVLLVVDGECRGRKLFDNINLQNPNNQCEEIGRRTFAALCVAVGVPATDTTQLLNKAVIAHVKVKDNQNNVRTYSVPEYSQVAQVPPPISTTQAPVVPAPAPVQPVAPPEPSSPAPAHMAPTPMAPTPVVQPPVQQAPVQGSRPWDR